MDINHNITKDIIKWTCVLFLLLAVFTALSGCAGDTAPSETPDAENQQSIVPAVQPSETPDAEVENTESSESSETVESDGETPKALYVPGVYTGTGVGFNKSVELTVTVIVDEYSITGVVVNRHGDTDGIGTLAFSGLPGAIIAANGTQVDVVSGATMSSRGMLEAVDEALEKARLGD